MAFTNNPMLVLILRVIQTILAILTLGLTAYGKHKFWRGGNEWSSY